MHSHNPFPQAAPDFSDPLALLLACHQRIAQHCDLLQRIGRQLHQRGHDSAIEQAAARVHRYFSTAARHHHDDEEQDLFPLLAQHSDELAERIQGLHQQHRQLTTVTEAILPLLEHPAAIPDLHAFVQQSERFCDNWLTHIRDEEAGLFSQARQYLTTDEITGLGRRMALRRGITPRNHEPA